MSVDQLPPGNARPAKRDAQFVRYDEYIDKQIQATRRSVKTVDIMTALLVMVTGTLGFLLTAAIVEHWLVPDGFNLAERLLLFVALFGGLAFYTTRRLWPLIAGSINPAYAAQTIEHENPSLKNSLLNLLLFREHRDDITDAVYETLEEQAAKRLTRVPVESAVDRTQLLRLGYVLIGILAAVALYKIFSPKDPFVSAERVLMPWARIARASRVSIENVEPGVVTVARGDVLTVSADIRGISDDDPVVVRYTTADGQAVDRPAQMTPSSAGLRFTGQIPPATDGTKAGVAQNLRYRIEAGDARSLEYAVTVVSAPTITIERIDYDYPDYTLYVDRSVERLGDIRAIEGTRVTIHARANEPIEDAAIDFEADGRRDVRLTPSGSDAKAAFTLELRDDRQTPKFTSYVLRFTGISGRPNRDPVKFPIGVEPDRGPEVSILAPAEKTRDVRFDETLAIEVDAIDPDFALAEVRLQGEAAGNRVLDEKLLAQEHTGRYTGRHLFTPHEHDLKPGDVVRYWVTARDNRAPQPNDVTSDSQTLRIVGPNPQQPGQPPQDRTAQRDQQGQRNKPEPQPGGESKEGQEGQGGQSGGQSSDSSEGNQRGESQGESASADGQKGQSGEQNSSNQSGEGDSNSTENQSGEQSNDQSNPSQSGESQSGESKSGNNSGRKDKPSAGNESSSGEKGNDSGEAQQQPGGGKSSGQNGKPSDANQDPSQQPGANESGSEQDNTNPSESKPGSNGEGGDPKSGSESSPVSSEGDNDGEAFERIQDFLKQQGKLPKEGESKDPGESASDSGDPGESQGESASADGKQGNADENAKPSNDANTPDANTPDSNSNESDSNADSKSEQDQQGEPASGSGEQSRTTGGKEPQPSDPSDASRQRSADKSESGEPSDEHGAKEDQQSQSPDGQHTSSEGESGAGQQPEESQGSPESPADSKPGDKWQQKPSGDQQGEKKGDGQDPPSGGQGKKKNDSQGDQGGDRSGGGEEGAGQKSEREGTGSAGQNQSADEGAGESSEQGAGHNSPNAGQDAQSKDPTGQSGNEEKGNGSTQREGAGEQPGGAENQTGEPASAGGNQPQGTTKDSKSPNQNAPDPNAPKQNSPDSQNPNPQQSTPQDPNANQPNPNPSEQNSQQPGSKQPNAQQPSPLSQDSNSSSSTADGAGRVPNGTMQPSASTGEAPEADAANLEYARKQTDLVLETLAEQMKRKQVDKKLLDKLGWSEADLKRFLDRWQQLKAAAQDDSPVADEAQRELDDALRSLGLRRGQLQQSKATDDTNRNLRQGYRGAIPLEYQERLRAYNQGVSRARQSDE